MGADNWQRKRIDRNPGVAHEIGAPLDTLSIHEFAERIAVLEAEIVRLRAAQAAKHAAQDAAGSVFKPR